MSHHIVGDTSASSTPHTPSNRVLGVFVALCALLVLITTLAGAGPASGETPGERCARETSAYNAAWAASWAATNPGQSPADAPPPPVPYVCVEPQDPTTTPTSPTTTAPGLPQATDTGTGPQVGAHAPTDIPAAGATPIVPVAPPSVTGAPGSSFELPSRPPAQLPRSGGARQGEPSAAPIYASGTKDDAGFGDPNGDGELGDDDANDNNEHCNNQIRQRPDGSYEFKDPSVFFLKNRNSVTETGGQREVVYSNESKEYGAEVRAAIGRWEDAQQTVSFREANPGEEPTLRFVDDDGPVEETEDGGITLGTWQDNGEAGDTIKLKKQAFDKLGYPSFKVTNVVTHEVGHSLGLAHGCAGTNMYAYTNDMNAYPSPLDVALLAERHSGRY